MYQALRRSLITLGREAGNARLFEATGVGTFLLTDFKDNLQTSFEPSREVVA
jgi:spore maturation protein CgeB